MSRTGPPNTKGFDVRRERKHQVWVQRQGAREEQEITQIEQEN